MQQRPDEQTLLTTCPRDCYDACGMMVVIRDGRIQRVRGDPRHPVSRGKLCKKCSVGYNGAWLDADQRLTRPLRRVGAKGQGRFQPLSWEQALEEIAGRLQAIVRDHGPAAVLNTHYTGTFSLIGYHFPQRFFNRLGATEVSPDTICNNAGHVALGYVYGSSLLGFDPRSADRAGCILVWGANPSASAPHAHEHWLAEAPGAVVVVDPVRTPTAARADLHLQPFPGSDAALAFGLMHLLRRDGLLDRAFIRDHTLGWEALEPLLRGCTPEWTAATTGVPVPALERAARLYGGGPSLLWLGQGFQRQPRGGNAMRACALLPAITGNLGKPGAGFLYLNGLGQRGIDDAYLMGIELCRGRAPPSLSQMDLAACLEDPSRSRALFCWNINIAASNPEQARLHRALAREDLLTVVADVFATDTVDYADYVLPAASFLEHDDLVASYFDLSLSAVVKAAEPAGESLANSEIFRRLARAMGYEDPPLFEADRTVIDKILAQTGLGETFESLAAKGTVFIAQEPVTQFADLRFPTPSGKVEMASAAAEADGHPRLPQPHADPRPAEDRLRLLSPASEWLLNDSFANDPGIGRRLGPPSIALHPEDASQRGIQAGDRVRVANATGSLELEAAIRADLPPGVCLSPKGRWPKLEPAGSNVNRLNPGLKSDLGESTCVHGIEVTVQRLDGPGTTAGGKR